MATSPGIWRILQPDKHWLKLFDLSFLGFPITSDSQGSTLFSCGAPGRWMWYARAQPGLPGSGWPPDRPGDRLGGEQSAAANGGKSGWDCERTALPIHCQSSCCSIPKPLLQVRGPGKWKRRKPQGPSRRYPQPTGGELCQFIL
jgi:hypothetical protein